LHKRLSENIELTYKLLQFGSSVLNATDVDSDIDMLLVTYECLLDRQQFFTILSKHLISSKFITQLQEVSEATVPIIKFQCGEVKIDLLFACALLPFN
jgi:poly(A) polymerase Pap1